jgi:hypothetical protein
MVITTMIIRGTAAGYPHVDQRGDLLNRIRGYGLLVPGAELNWSRSELDGQAVYAVAHDAYWAMVIAWSW